MYQSLGYILNRRPFRESSQLLDIFTEDYGRICCVARPAKKRGKVVKGDIEPFRMLQMQWIGKGDVQTLIDVEEKGRHDIPPSELMFGLYLNELLLKLTRQHVSQTELFSAYKFTLHKLHDVVINRHILMRFELYLLNMLGYPIDETVISKDELNESSQILSFNLDDGLIIKPHTSFDTTSMQSQGITISKELFLALQDIQNMQESEWKALRSFLDKVLSIMVNRPLNSRKFLDF